MAKKSVKKVDKKVTKPKKKCDQWNCYYCSNPISENEKQTILTTGDKGKVVEEVFFHFPCWHEYFETSVLKVSQKRLNTIQKKAVDIFNNPMLAGLLSKIGGTDKLMEMVSKPIGENKDFENLTKMISSPISNKKVKKNGRKKPNRKTKVSKV
jgi:hypothetical protein